MNLCPSPVRGLFTYHEACLLVDAFAGTQIRVPSQPEARLMLLLTVEDACTNDHLNSKWSIDSACLLAKIGKLDLWEAEYVLAAIERTRTSDSSSPLNEALAEAGLVRPPGATPARPHYTVLTYTCGHEESTSFRDAVAASDPDTYPAPVPCPNCRVAALAVGDRAQFMGDPRDILLAAEVRARTLCRLQEEEIPDAPSAVHRDVIVRYLSNGPDTAWWTAERFSSPADVMRKVTTLALPWANKDEAVVLIAHHPDPMIRQSAILALPKIQKRDQAALDANEKLMVGKG